MKVFLIVMVFLFAGEFVSVLKTPPGMPREPLSSAAITLIAALDLVCVVWAGVLLATGAA